MLAGVIPELDSAQSDSAEPFDSEDWGVANAKEELIMSGATTCRVQVFKPPVYNL